MPESSHESNGTRPDDRNHFYQQSWVRYASLLLILFIVVGFWFYSESLIGSIESLRSELAGTRSELARQQQYLKTLSASEFLVYSLRGDFPADRGTVFFEPSSRTALLYMPVLPPAHRDSLYQLWTLHGKHPVAAGSFSNDSTVIESFWYTAVIDSSAGKPDGFLVTRESQAHPTTPSAQILLQMAAPRR